MSDEAAAGEANVPVQVLEVRVQQQWNRFLSSVALSSLLGGVTIYALVQPYDTFWAYMMFFILTVLGVGFSVKEAKSLTQAREKLAWARAARELANPSFSSLQVAWLGVVGPLLGLAAALLGKGSD